MVIVDFFWNRSRCKSTDPHHDQAAPNDSKTSKLSRFFKKLTHPELAPHRSDHRHLLKRPSMAQMNPPIFQSDSQIPIIGQPPDKDKMYERRHYQEKTNRMQQQHRQLFMEHQYTPNQNNNQLTTSHNDDDDSTQFIRRRPSLTTSPSFDEMPPSLPSFASSRNCTINASTHSDNNGIRSNDNFGDDHNTSYIHSGYNSGLDDTKHENNNGNDGESEVLGGSLGDDSSESIGILLTKSMAMEPLAAAAKKQQQQNHAPWILQELRRMNTISNGHPSRQHNQHQVSSLQRNRSYVIRKGRFEISIEPSD